MACTVRTNKAVVDRANKVLASTKDPLEKLRAACLTRGATGIKGLGRTFKIYDDDGNRSLDINEFCKGLHDYGILDMEKADMQELFNIFDKDGSGSIDFDEFLCKLRPPMSKSRKALVLKAFQKLDKTGDGTITAEDLKGVYDVRKHKKYLSGEWSEEQCLGEFLNTFDSDDKDGKITKDEWDSYYAGVSSSIDSDAYFDLMMRNAWKI